MSCIPQYSATFLFPQSNNIIMAFCLYWMPNVCCSHQITIKANSVLIERIFVKKLDDHTINQTTPYRHRYSKRKLRNVRFHFSFGGFLLKQSDGEGAEVKKSLCKHSSFLINIYNSTWTLWLPELEAVLNCFWNCNWLAGTYLKTVQSERSI